MGERKAFNIKIADTRPIEEVEIELQQAGLGDIHVFKAIGLIQGSADEEAVSQLMAVPGVDDVASDIYVDLGPRGADPAW